MSCPPTKPAIAVITPNILIGLGLRTILEKVGPPGEIAVFDSFTEFIASGPERYFHYFAAMQVFMRHRTFFLENGHKTILLEGGTARGHEQHRIEVRSLEGLLGTGEMPQVRGVEGAPHDTQPRERARPCPLRQRVHGAVHRP